MQEYNTPPRSVTSWINRWRNSSNAKAALPLVALLENVTPRQRAIEQFGRLRIWDTEHNCGVLIYVLLADRTVEIIADRGINARKDANEWEDICTNMQREFASGRFEAGAIAGIRAISDLLGAHFPVAGRDNPNDLPDRPILL
ncbi:MAG: hypothetical protein EXR27_03075 [Betaproteobacteria bacterium]|nr:hypothetical protein [Betaproteobacteria bacterium]